MTENTNVQTIVDTAQEAVEPHEIHPGIFAVHDILLHAFGTVLEQVVTETGRDIWYGTTG